MQLDLRTCASSPHASIPTTLTRIVYIILHEGLGLLGGCSLLGQSFNEDGDLLYGSERPLPERSSRSQKASKRERVRVSPQLSWLVLTSEAQVLVPAIRANTTTTATFVPSFDSAQYQIPELRPSRRRQMAKQVRRDISRL